MIARLGKHLRYVLKRLDSKAAQYWPNEQELLARSLPKITFTHLDTPNRVAFQGMEIEYIDLDILRAGIYSQWEQGVNDLHTDKPDPLILDCGANIGLSVLRYKYLFPEARIIAFEADPLIFQTLQRNMEYNGFHDVTLVQSAVWTNSGHLEFLSDGRDGGKLLTEITSEVDAQTTKVSVPTIDLATYLDEPIDFVKLDIEGAELPVLRHCATNLGNIKKLIVEVHYRMNQPEILTEILQILGDAGFYLSIATPPLSWDYHLASMSISEYAGQANRNGDIYPQIYGWRSVSD